MLTSIVWLLVITIAGTFVLNLVEYRITYEDFTGEPYKSRSIRAIYHDMCDAIIQMEQDIEAEREDRTRRKREAERREREYYIRQQKAIRQYNEKKRMMIAKRVAAAKARQNRQVTRTPNPSRTPSGVRTKIVRPVETVNRSAAGKRHAVG